MPFQAKGFLIMWTETWYTGNQLSVWQGKIINYYQWDKCVQQTCTWVISLRIKCDSIQDLTSDLNQLLARLSDHKSHHSWCFSVSFQLQGLNDDTRFLAVISFCLKENSIWASYRRGCRCDIITAWRLKNLKANKSIF